MHISGFISQKPKDFPWIYGKNSKAHDKYLTELRKAVEVAVDLDKVTTFYCGMEHPADLDFAEAVIFQKENKYPEIKLVCIVTSHYDCKDFNKQDIDRYNSILAKANDRQEIYGVSLNKHLIDNSERLTVVWNEKEVGEVWDCIKYAIEQHKLVYFIRLDEIKADTADPNGKLKRELNEANHALKKAMFTRIAYTFLIQELVKQHPNPKTAFNKIIGYGPSFKQEITALADLIELDLSVIE